MPYPHVFLVDKDGRVRGKFREDRYQDRPTPDSILHFIEALSKKAAGDEAR